jgi:hypothetical protein
MNDLTLPACMGGGSQNMRANRAEHRSDHYRLELGNFTR